MRRLLPGGGGTLAVAWLLMFAQPVAAGHCWGGSHSTGNVGAYYANTVWNRGARSLQDFESATVPTGQAIVHPMQVGSGSGDFIGWGTARGLGTHDPNAASNCPDDYTSGWHVYIDGTKFGVYFCRQTYGTVSGNANDQLFTLKYGSCNGLVRWRAVLNGDLKTCQIIDGDDANVAVVGGEVIGTTGQLHVDIHYDDLLRYYSPTDYWYMWHFDDASECTSLGYRLRFIAADDVWIEEIP